MTTPVTQPSLGNIIKAMKPLPPSAKAAQQPALPVKRVGHGDKVAIKHAPNPAPPGPGSYKLEIPKDDAAEMFHVQADVPNMQALANWLNSFDTPSTLGPTAFSPNPRLSFERAYANDPQMLARVQQALARRGYNVRATGTWDSLTSNAVVQFKHSRGIHEPFKTPDGKFAITPFLDASMTNQILN
jgi:hypothetical protein